MLYRQDLGLDPRRSRMAVVVQEVVTEDRSGVAFGRGPRGPAEDCEVIEAVAGPCGDLVDGAVDPDRWLLRRASGEVVEWRAGARPVGGDSVPLLGGADLMALHRTLGLVEQVFGWPPDLEWTGRAERLTVLQARQVTTAAGADAADKRAWYLTLRPGPRRLRELRRRVADDSNRHSGPGSTGPLPTRIQPCTGFPSSWRWWRGLPLSSTASDTSSSGAWTPRLGGGGGAFPRAPRPDRPQCAGTCGCARGSRKAGERGQDRQRPAARAGGAADGGGGRGAAHGGAGSARS